MIYREKQMQARIDNMLTHWSLLSPQSLDHAHQARSFMEEHNLAAAYHHMVLAESYIAIPHREEDTDEED